MTTTRRTTATTWRPRAAPSRARARPCNCHRRHRPNRSSSRAVTAPPLRTGHRLRCTVRLRPPTSAARARQLPSARRSRRASGGAPPRPSCQVIPRTITKTPAPSGYRQPSEPKCPIRQPPPHLPPPPPPPLPRGAGPHGPMMRTATHGRCLRTRVRAPAPLEGQA